MVSGNMLSRAHKENTTARLVYQTNSNHDMGWYNYLLSLLGPFCSGLVKKTKIIVMDP